MSSNITSADFNGKRTPKMVLADAMSEVDSYDDIILVVVDKNHD